MTTHRSKERERYAPPPVASDNLPVTVLRRVDAPANLPAVHGRPAPRPDLQRGGYPAPAERQPTWAYRQEQPEAPRAQPPAVRPASPLATPRTETIAQPTQVRTRHQGTPPRRTRSEVLGYHHADTSGEQNSQAEERRNQQSYHREESHYSYDQAYEHSNTAASPYYARRTQEILAEMSSISKETRALEAERGIASADDTFRDARRLRECRERISSAAGDRDSENAVLSELEKSLANSRETFKKYKDELDKIRSEYISAMKNDEWWNPVSRIMNRLNGIK